ncbi:probable E3 ubiquitin-protein ligase XERICO [Papaver somniferum]|uniref:probable E3 ubiquitin-protein ligase XERICO n=1 Tax=Papaver somniferum TaxID=3469 RepID=UPI000E6FA581|nr:probable E3 ubiquitin-protein ligase XERICO [Papaver somniferum]
MGLSHYPSPAEGMLPVIVMNTVVSVALLKNMVKWVIQVMIGIENPSSNFEEENTTNEVVQLSENRKISVTLYKSLCDERSSRVCKSSSDDDNNSNSSFRLCSVVECCVCLHKFKANEEVSELSCNHFFHKGCLKKWLDHRHSTCPLCRSTL